MSGWLFFHYHLHSLPQESSSLFSIGNQMKIAAFILLSLWGKVWQATIRFLPSKNWCYSLGWSVLTFISAPVEVWCQSCDSYDPDPWLVAPYLNFFWPSLSLLWAFQLCPLFQALFNCNFMLQQIWWNNNKPKQSSQQMLAVNSSNISLRSIYVYCRCNGWDDCSSLVVW